jgi:hypothetical protein
MKLNLETYLNYLNEIDNWAPVGDDSLQLGRRLYKKILNNPDKTINPIPDPPATSYDVVETLEEGKWTALYYKIKNKKIIPLTKKASKLVKDFIEKYENFHKK